MAASIDDFLASVPEDQRAALEDLRRTIRAAAPEATELINYGVPAFKLNGRPFVSMDATKGHCSFYVQSPAVMEEHAAELKGYDTTKHSPLHPGQAHPAGPRHQAGEGPHRRSRGPGLQVVIR